MEANKLYAVNTGLALGAIVLITAMALMCTYHRQKQYTENGYVQKQMSNGRVIWTLDPNTSK